jgi:hypothetical protein
LATTNDPARTANRIAWWALIVAVFAAAFTGWQAFEAHWSNQFQVQQSDITVAGNVLIARASDYPARTSSSAANGTQIVINLNHTPVANVSAELDSSSNMIIETIGDMPGCTEVNVQKPLDPTFLSMQARRINYTLTDGKVWQRAFLGTPSQGAYTPPSGMWFGTLTVPSKDLIPVPGC